MGKINFLQTDVLQLLEPWNSGEAFPPLILDSIDNIETGESMTLYRYLKRFFFFFGRNSMLENENKSLYRMGYR